MNDSPSGGTHCGERCLSSANSPSTSTSQAADGRKRETKSERIGFMAADEFLLKSCVLNDEILPAESSSANINNNKRRERLNKNGLFHVCREVRNRRIECCCEFSHFFLGINKDINFFSSLFLVIYFARFSGGGGRLK